MMLRPSGMSLGRSANSQDSPHRLVAPPGRDLFHSNSRSPPPDPGFQQGMATEGEQRHEAVLHREPSDLRVKDNIALDQTLAMADKSSFVRA